MAQPDLIRFNRKAFAIDAAGSAVTSAADVIEVLDGAYSTETDTVEEVVDSAFMASTDTAITNKRGIITGTVRLLPPVTPGDAGADGKALNEKLLRACGLAVTIATDLTTYNPASSSFYTADAKEWQGDTLFSVTNAKADIEEILFEIGARPNLKFNLQGTYAAITDVAMPTDTGTVLANFLKNAISTNANSTLILNSLGTAAITNLHLRAKRLKVTGGNEIVTHEYTEYKTTDINDRKPTFEARFAKPAMADFNPTALRDSEELITLEYTVTEADGRWTKLGVRGQILTVANDDIDGKFGLIITGNCRASATGGDEFYIEFGAP